MELYKISKLLNDSTVSKFLTKKWVEVNDLSRGEYYSNKKIRLKNSSLILHLCGYSHAYIVEKRRIDLLDAAENKNDKAD